MKYLLINDKNQQKQALIDNIAEFLWNNGNEIYVRADLDKNEDYRVIKSQYDCIVYLIFRDDSIESFFPNADTEARNSLNKKFVLIFSKNGVYCNALPFPHKIFHFDGLNQHELTRFFLWCENLKLFIT
ncbi:MULTISPECIES: hypothetical protein [unclassified Sphingobacterium]|uniref:hypothetical protein n=1 Tax=unclassified Sphingobacterium TaxID=2609468 RepID=UPI0025F89917|nr:MULTISPECIES: hypothetical protein [unclassified Sphingobacterium]